MHSQSANDLTLERVRVNEQMSECALDSIESLKVLMRAIDFSF